MSLYSINLPAGAQFDENAPWESDYVEKSIHEIDAEPFGPSTYISEIPETEASRAWKQRLANSLKKEVK